MNNYFFHKLYSYSLLYSRHVISKSLSIFFQKRSDSIPILRFNGRKKAKIDKYWSNHTVNALNFVTRWESDKYFEWVINEYPLIDVLMEFNRNHKNSVVLDYGCGTGNDLYRFLIKNKALKVIGIDVSHKALRLAAKRLSLYDFDKKKIQLILNTDLEYKLPVKSKSIDYLNCAGVLMYVSYPGKILREFYRVMKNHSEGIIMVYNYDSIWLHFYTAYKIMILDNKFQGLEVEEAFSKTTDSEDCPQARCFRNEEFLEMCEKAGFKAQYIGSYLSVKEINAFKNLAKDAVKDKRLAKKHKEFLKQITLDKKEYPKFKGKYAGVSGVYKIYKN